MSLVQHIRYHYIFRKFPFTKQFIKFSLVGTISTLTDFSVYYVLTRSFEWFAVHFLYANACAFLIAVTWSFIANKFWTFRNREKDYVRQYPKFITVYVLGFAGSQGILYVLVSELNFFDITAKIIAVGIILFWNFTINKLWTFKERRMSY